MSDRIQGVLLFSLSDRMDALSPAQIAWLSTALSEAHGATLETVETGWWLHHAATDSKHFIPAGRPVARVLALALLCEAAPRPRRHPDN